MEELVKYMRALVLLQVRQLTSREEGAERPKPELLLSQAGFTAREISELTGKSVAAVSKAIARAKAAVAANAAKEEVASE